MEIAMRLESLKEELEAAKSSFSDIQNRNETLQLSIKALTEDKVKLDNKLVEEMNLHKLKIAEMEAEQDILRNKIKEKDNLVKKFEIQVQQLREQLAASVSSDQASTTFIIDVSDKRRKQRQLGQSSSYKEGLMNRFGGLYRSTSESKMVSERSQFGQPLSNFSSTEQFAGETVVSTSMVTTESQLESTTQDSSSRPSSDDVDKKSGRKASDSQGPEKGRRPSDRGKDRNRADCKQN